MHHRLYALQRRLAITSAESLALLLFAGLLLTGFCVRYVQGQSVPYEAEQYAALDSAFAAHSEPFRLDAPESTEEPGSTGADEPDDKVGTAGAEEPRAPRRTAKAGPVRMNLNTASEQLLQRLPGIGPKMAARISEYRAAHGDFARPRDIVRVKGIGPKTYEKLAPYLFVEEANEGGE